MSFQVNFTLEMSTISIENLFGYKPVLDTIFYQKSLELTQFLRSTLLILNKTTLSVRVNFTIERSKISIENPCSTKYFSIPIILPQLLQNKSLDVTFGCNFYFFTNRCLLKQLLIKNCIESSCFTQNFSIQLILTLLLQNN